MKTFLHLTGSISKNEILTPIKTNILPETCVAEASEPYSGYYGRTPETAKPNSIFLFTRKIYFLEEILDLNRNIQKCVLDDLNMASAIINIQGKQYPAIRLKFFPDYRKIVDLQQCFLKQGIKFAAPIHLNGSYAVTIHKIFKLEEVNEGIYIDKVESGKGYFTLPGGLTDEQFQTIHEEIRNNSACRLFDAEQGMLLVNGRVVHLARIFAEGIDTILLECVQKQFLKRLPQANPVKTEKV